MIHAWSATEIVDKIKAKEVSPVEVMDHFLGRITALNPQINAFVTLADAEARQAAKQAEEAVVHGSALGPLHGVPVAIKDLTVTKGIRTTYGSPAYKDYIPDRDATVVQRLKQAGAIVVGKTNTPEFGHKGTTDNLLFGATKNPWHLAMTAGGSSGGAAAAVAARLVPVAEGSDGGGSIRIPASFCGVYGFKPTFGRIPYDSNLSNVFSAHEPFLHHGTLTHAVEDAALLLQVMQGPTATDPFSLPRTDVSYREEMKKSVAGLKLAYTPDFGMYEVAPDVQRKVRETLAQWRALGCTVEEVSLDFGMDLRTFITFFESMWHSAAAAGSGALLEEHPELVSESMQYMIRKGYALSAVEFRQLEYTRTKLWLKVQEVMQTYDALLSPTLAVTAFPHELLGPREINGRAIKRDSDWMLTQMFNVTGMPAASLPVGFSADGLPIGLQIAADRFNEGTVLRLSHAFESAYGTSGVPSTVAPAPVN